MSVRKGFEASELQEQMMSEVRRILDASEYWTQTRLAEHLELNAGQLSLMLNGKVAGKMSLWCRIFDALGYSITVHAQRHW